VPEADLLYVVIQWVQHGINAIGALIIAVGVAEAAVRFVRLRLTHKGDGITYGTQRIRERLGLHLLLALDVFIGADLLGTVVHPDWTNIGVLAAIVAIRIVLSFLLTREIEEARRVLQDGPRSE
jgi:uncharacterized membrane protein